MTKHFRIEDADFRDDEVVELVLSGMDREPAILTVTKDELIELLHGFVQNKSEEAHRFQYGEYEV